MSVSYDNGLSVFIKRGEFVEELTLLRVFSYFSDPLLVGWLVG